MVLSMFLYNINSKSKEKKMNKISDDSIALGICMGVAFGLILNDLALGIALGAGLGIAGSFASKKKK